jgi:hypothetical protein
MFSFYKSRFKQRANRIALYYISFLEISVLLVLGMFFAAFFSQMNVDALSSEGTWTLFVIAAVIIGFKNWMKYNGKKRMIIKAKSQKINSSRTYIMLLWMLPLACIALTFILYNAV